MAPQVSKDELGLIMLQDWQECTIPVEYGTLQRRDVQVRTHACHAFQ